MKQQEVVKQATAGIIRDGEDSESDEEDVNTRQSSSAVASKLDDGEAHNKLIQGIMNEEEEKTAKEACTQAYITLGQCTRKLQHDVGRG